MRIMRVSIALVILFAILAVQKPLEAGPKWQGDITSQEGSKISVAVEFPRVAGLSVLSGQNSGQLSGKVTYVHVKISEDLGRHRFFIL